MQDQDRDQEKIPELAAHAFSTDSNKLAHTLYASANVYSLSHTLTWTSVGTSSASDESGGSAGRWQHSVRDTVESPLPRLEAARPSSTAFVGGTCRCDRYCEGGGRGAGWIQANIEGGVNTRVAEQKQITRRLKFCVCFLKTNERCVSNDLTIGLGWLMIIDLHLSADTMNVHAWRIPE